MKLTLTLIFLVVFTGCTNYTKIDGKNWTKFSSTYKTWEITYELPNGYLISSRDSGKYILLGNYHYDVLQGAGIYGDPWGETSIVYFISEETEKEKTLRISSLPSEGGEHCQTRQNAEYEGIFCIRPERKIYSERYTIQLDENAYLNVISVVSGLAFNRSKVRDNRVKMFSDIMGKLKIERPNKYGQSDTAENAVQLP